MRKLHVVGFTSDLDGLIFSTRKGSKSGSFVVSIGEELLEKLDEVQRLRNGGEATTPASLPSRRDDRERRPRPESSLTPREIQARLRAGRTIDEVAREAGVDTDWVERFAAPILAEQRQVVELARSLTFAKARLGESAEPLGESVAANLADRGVRILEDEFDASWSAFQVRDGVWTVQFRYRSRSRLQQATWELDVAANRVVSRDRLASDLGYLERSRRRRRLAESAEEAEAVAEASPVVVRAAPAGRTAAAPATPPARRPPARRAPASKARTQARAGAATEKASAAKRATGPAGKPAANRANGPAAKAARGAAGKPAANRANGPAAKRATGPAGKPARGAAGGTARKTAGPTRAAPPGRAAKAPRAAKAAKAANGTKGANGAKAANGTKAARPAGGGRAATPAKAARAQAAKGRGGERSTPAPPAAEAPPGTPAPRPRRPLAPRPTGLG
ncbi:MAG TPA: septation protein SepH, partial [Acidimicrobiales bacterium]|nr:septation protein SepH [Acidimicrobiales bacterium]